MQQQLDSTNSAAMSCHRELEQGWVRRDRGGQPILYRYLTPSDDVEQITALLHEAYGALARMGMRFVASYQDHSTTRRRMAKGETIVAVDGDRVVGVVTLASTANTAGSPFYDRPDVASFGQFAVLPSHQRRGIGSTLLDIVERRAAEQGVSAIALDTSERASHLIEMYRSRGYHFVEYCQWNVTNYRSVLLAKELTRVETGGPADSACPVPTSRGS